MQSVGMLGGRDGFWPQTGESTALSVAVVMTTIPPLPSPCIVRLWPNPNCCVAVGLDGGSGLCSMCLCAQMAKPLEELREEIRTDGPTTPPTLGVDQLGQCAAGLCAAQLREEQNTFFFSSFVLFFLVISFQQFAKGFFFLFFLNEWTQYV